MLSTFLTMIKPSPATVSRWAVVMLGVLLHGLSASGQTTADGLSNQDERETAFLDALKQRGYDELIEHYLGQMASSATVSEEWKGRILFERAAILMRWAESNPTPEVAERLQEAKKLLQEFVETQPASPRIDDAKLELAKLRLAEARREVVAAGLPENESAKQKLLENARTSFNSARKQFQQLKNALGAKLKQASSPDVPAVDPEALDKLRRDALFAELSATLIEYEKASLFTPGDAQHQQQLQAAQKEFAKLSKEHRERLLGLEAIYYQGVCQQELADPAAALEYFEELMRIESLPGSLSARTLSRAINCMCHESVNTVSQAIGLGERWFARRPADVTDADLAAVQLAMAKAYLTEAGSLDSRKQQRSYDAAREQLLAAARVPGGHQAEARVLLAGLPASSVSVSSPRGEGPTSADFQAAKTAADAVREQLQSTMALWELQKRNLETAQGEAHQAEARQQFEETDASLRRFESSALEHYQRALAVADETVTEEALNDTRYMIAFLCYRQQRYLDAAAVAGFVAERYGASDAARQCAQIATAAFWQLFQAAGGADSAFETAHLVQLSELIAQRWPNTAAATDALANLVTLMVRNDDLDRAEAFLQRIPENSAARADAEMRTGVALWHKCQLAARRADAADKTASDPAAAGRSERAEKFLVDGLQHAGDREVDAMMANAALAQVQIKLAQGDHEAALALLHAEKIGPLRLLTQNHPAAQARLFAEQTYCAELKALVARLTNEALAEQAIERVKEVMSLLQKAADADPDGQRRLVSIYVDLAKDLRRQIDAADADGKARLIRGFEVLLARVSESAESLGVRNWIAEAYTEMAASLPVSETGITEEARRFYGEAERVYTQLLESAAHQPPLTEVLTTQIHVKRANIRGQLGRHKDAIDDLETVLKARNNLVSIQMDAARTFQQAGTVGSNQLYELAIKGGRPNEAGENVIWGWERISKVVARQMQRDEKTRAQFADMFFEARWNIAKCRALQAARMSGEDRAALIGNGLRAIKVTEGLYPDLGGPAWQTKFAAIRQELENLP